MARLQRKRFDMRARTMGMTLAQWRAIYAISRAQGATQRSIAEAMDVGDVTAGRLVDRLVEKGWIERRVDHDDRRVHRLYLTPVAGPLLEQLSMLGEDEQRNQLAGVSAQELAHMSDVLDRMIANLEQADMPLLPPDHMGIE
ncbi:MarR family winged helix-turn-helix transcriptional regulator [Sphingobium sp. Z007]|uniref:MarR family winged helix-turn-helix transcriptional regulator n=1 Tax=Sphingobium sp. Z007 TaxID=627495 RepID=UPI001595E1F6|nr:MarR family transcriptional regulator [Sphingobium sp. Z007]